MIWSNAAHVGRVREIRAEHDARVTELLENNNRSLQEARDARAETRRARMEADALWSRCLQLEAQVRRVDPAWRDACRSA